MLKVVLISVIILLICVTLLCIKMIFKKNGRFPDTHVESSPALRSRGITCARSQDFEAGLRLTLADRLDSDVR
ncbi:MAG: hypothetical protein LBR84_03900 [Tannerella sp.]|nr:hypothetical protein [Tannerella sp.]